MARLPAPIPPTLPWPVLHLRELLDAGMSAQHVRRADLVSLRRGLYARRGIPITEIDVVAALCRADPTLVVVDLSVARMLDAPLPRAMSPWRRGMPVHVNVTDPSRRGSSDSVLRFHARALERDETCRFRTPVSPTGVRSVLPITSPARTWRDLARYLDLGQLVEVGDHLVRTPRRAFEGRSTPWTSVRELAEHCTGPHSARLRAALADVRAGADSPMETRLRLAFARAGLPAPLLNQPMVAADGRALHSPDFSWPRWRVCGEYEGRTHSAPDQITKDIARTLRAEAAGWVELRFAAPDAANDCARAVHRTREALLARGWVG